MLRVERIDLGGEFHSCCKHSFGPSGAVNDLSVSTKGGGTSYTEPRPALVRLQTDSSVMAWDTKTSSCCGNAVQISVQVFWSECVFYMMMMMMMMADSGASPHAGFES